MARLVRFFEPAGPQRLTSSACRSSAQFLRPRKSRSSRILSLLFPLLLVATGFGLDKKSNETSEQTRGEKFLVAALRRNGDANLGMLPEGERNIRASVLRKILFSMAESEIPSRTIRISGAVVKEPLVMQGEHADHVSRAVVFSSCDFHSVALYAVHFEQGLTFARSSFQQGLFLNRVHTKGDVLISGIRRASEGEEIRIVLDGAYIDGQLTMQSIEAPSIRARGLTAQSVRVDLTPDSTLKKIDLSQLEAESLTIAEYRTTSISLLQELWLSEASIKRTFRLSRVIVSQLHAPGLAVEGRADLDDGVGIRDSLDLSRASLGTFDWGVVQCGDRSDLICWPQNRDLISLGGVSFRSINIRSYTLPDPKADTPAAWSTEDKSLQFLDQATFSESAYLSYEQLLRNRGLIADADEAYRDMRAHRRAATWQNSKGFLGKIGAVAYIGIDLLQKEFLGYGRSALPPLLWSLAFVVFGTVAFRKEASMESVNEHPPRFSAFWYSLELFLPVVDLGVAKSWRPSQRSLPLLTYARIHQLAGWILIPVALAAITGAFK